MALGAFLGIQGAFDCTKPKFTLEAIRARRGRSTDMLFNWLTPKQRVGEVAHLGSSWLWHLGIHGWRREEGFSSSVKGLRRRKKYQVQNIKGFFPSYLFDCPSFSKKLYILIIVLHVYQFWNDVLMQFGIFYGYLFD